MSAITNHSARPEFGELRTTGTSTPILRAGYANWLGLIGPVFVVFVARFLNSIPIPGMVSVAILGLVVIGLSKIYLSAISSMSIQDGALTLTLPTKTLGIPIGDVVEISVREYRSFSAALLTIKLRTSVLPKHFFFVAVATNWGPLSQTVQRLRELLATLSPKST